MTYWVKTDRRGSIDIDTSDEPCPKPIEIGRNGSSTADTLRITVSEAKWLVEKLSEAIAQVVGGKSLRKKLKKGGSA